MAFPVIQSGLSGLAAGDLMIAVGAALSATEPFITIQNSTGWTTVNAQQPGGGGGILIAYKYANAADVTNAGSIGLSYSDGSSTVSVLNQKLFRVSGVLASGTVLSSNANSTSATPTTASITPLLQDLLLIITANINGGGAAGRTVSAQAIASNNPVWTELVDSQQSGTGGTFTANISLAYASQTAAANVATGIGSATLSGTAGLGAIALFAIQPPPTFAATIFGSSFTMNTPSFVRKTVVAIFGSSFGIFAPVSSGALAVVWTATQKGIADIWTKTLK